MTSIQSAPTHEMEVGVISPRQSQIDRKAIQDLLKPNPYIYWSDLVLSASLGWFFLIESIIQINVFLQILFIVLASIVLFRLASITHEISHFRTKPIRGFELIWNLVCGIPLLIPTFISSEFHLRHHHISNYGTSGDPEFIPLARLSKKDLIGYWFRPFLVPVLLIFRFSVLSVLLVVSPLFGSKISQKIRSAIQFKASSMSFNRLYTRQKPKRWPIEYEIATFLVFPILFWLLDGPTFLKYLSHWYFVEVCAMCISQIRTTLGHRHRFQADFELGSEGDHAEKWNRMLNDSNTLLGGIWVEILAPVGLRYHGMHHYQPDIPYHNLRKAHDRLIKTSPVYQKMPFSTVGNAFGQFLGIK